MGDKPQWQQVGESFVTFYYGQFDSDRSKLEAVYKDQSLLTFEGSQFQGTGNILGKLKGLTFQKVAHQVQTTDCQPLPDGVLVVVSGLLKTDDDEPQRFCQSFKLSNDNGNYWVANDVFRLCYG
eukprot:TRINITY_DN87934_c0_g1_i1.p1 TRINITY_DN87934_c0_g1~~TRINITY_DN87934_c0_g1_i1.p1  ORF type:complete len:124 (+),score=1.12 TRINITY_DN87934_c0_g1_i1:67-438(+)